MQPAKKGKVTNLYDKYKKAVEHQVSVKKKEDTGQKKKEEKGRHMSP